MVQPDVISAEPWTPASLGTGVLLLAATLALIFWLVLRYGGRDR